MDSINIDSLGLEGVFKEVLSLVSIMDLGMGGAITYKLFQAVAQKKDDEIEKLMCLYRILYFAMATGIFAIGMLAIPFIPILVAGTDLPFKYLLLVYILQLLGSVSSYFMGYYRLRIRAEQKDYQIARVDMWAALAGQVLRILVLLTLANYLIYITITIIQNVFSNILLSLLYKKQFGKITKKYVTINDIKELKLFKDIRNYLPYRLAVIIYSSTDNIVISSILGVGQVALFTNYTLIVNQLSLVVSKLVDPLLSGIANLIYSDEPKKGRKIIGALDMLFFMVGCYLCASVVVILQPFIKIWLGEQYLQSMGFVLLITANLYIVWAGKCMALFRDALGDFEHDKKIMGLAAIFNLLLSLALVRKFRFSGIIFGTVVGHIIIWYARTKVVFDIYLKEKMGKYLAAQIARGLLAGAECVVILFLECNFPCGWIGILERGFVTFLIINSFNILIFANNRDFKTLLEYVRATIRLQRNKI